MSDGRVTRRRALAGVGAAVGVAAGRLVVGASGRSRGAGDAPPPVEFGADYRTFQYDARNSGRTDSPGPTGAPSVRWRMPAPSFRVLPAVVDGVAYHPDSRGAIRTYDFETGRRRRRWPDRSAWHPDRTPPRFRHTPWVGDGVVYHTTPSDLLAHGLDGRFRWAADWDRETVPGGEPPVASDPVVADGTVVASLDDGVYGVDPGTGARVWKTPMDVRNLGSPAVADGTVYLSREDGYVYALEAATGEVVWSRYFGPSGAVTRDDDERVVVTSPTVADGTVFVAVGRRDDRAGAVHAIEAADGSHRWTAPTDGLIAGAPIDASVAVADDLVFATDSTPRLYAFDRANGSRRWAVDCTGQAGVAPVVADDAVYPGVAGDVSLRALSFDGTERWRVDLDGFVRTPPLVLGEYVLLGGALDGREAFLAVG